MSVNGECKLCDRPSSSLLPIVRTSRVYRILASSDITLVIVAIQEIVIEESFDDFVYPVGRVPVTEKVNESLFGSSATTVMAAVVLMVTLTSLAPTRIFGGKFSGGQEINMKINMAYTE